MCHICGIRELKVSGHFLAEPCLMVDEFFQGPLRIKELLIRRVNLKKSSCGFALENYFSSI